MKPIFKILPIFIFFITIKLGNAQDQIDHKNTLNKISIGVSAGENGYNSKIGLELGSPTLIKDRFCINVKGNLNWLEQYKANYDHWVKYKTVSRVTGLQYASS